MDLETLSGDKRRSEQTCGVPKYHKKTGETDSVTAWNLATEVAMHI